EIRDALQRADDGDAFLVDLATVTYADSTALTELLRFCVLAKNDGKPVAVVIQTPQFARLVQYAGLADAFPIFSDTQAALEYLNEAEPS
ncbi:MAG TPA: STAS domain-containing protein, partial [Candidatus Baltobacteraceae bacterium]|nr:STAS domain-containing protein [Candidatus Baltobacteraceae bacterium]